MKIKEQVQNIIPIDDINNYYVVADFDRTITDGNCNTSWSILSMCKDIPQGYNDERRKLYNKYRPIEINENMDFNKRSSLISEWYRRHFELFIKYQISDKVFFEAVNDLGIMKFRAGAKDFLTFLYQNNIPLIIISAGIGNIIDAFLKNNNCFFNNIYVCSNKILFKDGIAYSVDNNLIHSLNKNEVTLPDDVMEKLSGRKNVILLGDQLSDLNMVDNNQHDKVIKIGFYSTSAEVPLEYYVDKFDIVCNDSDNYYDLKELLFNEKRY